MRGRDRVECVASCSFSATPQAWHFAAQHAPAIDAHWVERTRANPSLFNGVVYILSSVTVSEGRCTGSFLRSDFKSYVYWHDHGYPEAGVRHGFGSGLLRSAEGHVILGRQRAGNLNSGQAYMPGGFIDQHDVCADGTIDIEASVTREVAEETGLGPDVLTREAGFLVTLAGALVSVAVGFRSHLSSRELQARIREHIATEDMPELADAVIVRDADELAAIDVPGYVRATLAWLFRQSSAQTKS